MMRTIAVLAVAPLLILPLLASAQTVCPSLSHNLSFGSKGAEVAALQNFLIGQGLLGVGNSTAYYGKLTQNTVQKWQAQNGLVSSGAPLSTGYGSVGPKTRTLISKTCLSNTSTTGNQQSFAQNPANDQEASLVCAIPGYCLVSQFVEGGVPAECEFGKTYSNPEDVQKDQAVFQHGSACQSSSSANPAKPTTPTVSTPQPMPITKAAQVGYSEGKAFTFIEAMYDTNAQLLKECDTCTRYWLWSDQLLGQLALKHSNPSLASTIDSKMNSYGVTMRSAWATLDPKYIAKASFKGTQELQVANSNVWYSDYGVGSDLSCANYADVAFLTAIYKYKTGDMAGALSCYNYGKAMWDGVGMTDGGQITGQYAVYKTALGLLAQKITGFSPIGIPDNYFDKFQATNGGITTDIMNGQPSGSQNIETTAAVLFAKNPGLLQ